MDSFRSHVKTANSNIKIASKNFTIVNSSIPDNELSGIPATSSVIYVFIPKKPEDAVKIEIASSIFQFPVHTRITRIDTGIKVVNIIRISSKSMFNAS